MLLYVIIAQRGGGLQTNVKNARAVIYLDTGSEHSLCMRDLGNFSQVFLWLDGTEMQPEILVTIEGFWKNFVNGKHKF